ncbi:methionine adenosyltransferase [Kiloniella sp. b19]|uniref:methionine adenosyltransferase n=1 Tax=Kiloniella sp. GXU_MW_B19 TaxID=3141326 RepID=UPI0031DCC734
MRPGSYQFTSESVSEGHPDKVCDRISDTIVDLYLSHDPEARIAVETMATTNRVVLAGEVRGPRSVTPDMIENAAREAVKAIGYEQDGFHWENMTVQNYIHEQSVDIAQGVDSAENKDEGAGDQGIMFGYACRETPAFMPAPIYYAHNILRSLAEVRHSGEVAGLGPDAKSQITLDYRGGVPQRATSVVVSTQHSEAMSNEEIREVVRQHVQKNLPEGWMCPEEEFYVNPTGRFVIGGPDGDAGLTGRKIIVDTYGGAAPHGGGAFSGKDPTKVDRSAAYAARYLAKNIVGAGLAERCTIQVSYAIGVSKPLSLYVNTHGTNEVDENAIPAILRDLMDLSPRGIREHLKLNRPIYTDSAAYGHFGRDAREDGSFSWERLDLVDQLKSAFNL